MVAFIYQAGEPRDLARWPHNFEPHQGSVQAAVRAQAPHIPGCHLAGLRLGNLAKLASLPSDTHPEAERRGATRPGCLARI